MSAHLGMNDLLELRRRAQACYKTKANQIENEFALFDIITTIAAWEIRTAISYGQIPDAQEILQEVGKVLLPDKPVAETTKAANKAKKAVA
jgi:hypothetical protein